MSKNGPGAFAARVDAFALRHPWTGYPLAVVYKFFDDQGGYLAALIAYYSFVSLFPLLLVFTTVLGIVLENNEGLRDQIVDSVLKQIPVVGEQLANPSSLSGGTAAVAIGLAGAIYGGLGVSVASQNAMNIAWAVPRNSRPNPILVRIRGALLLITVGLALIGLVALDIFSARIEIPRLAEIFTDVGTVLLALWVFIFAFRYGTARKVTRLQVLPGAIVAALGWQALEHFGRIYVEHVIARASAINGVFATVLGLVAFLYLASVMVVICLEINAVYVDKLYPRSLLTEFTDNVILTPGDERAYTRAAQAQRNKGFQTIEVSFDNPLEKKPDQSGDQSGDRSGDQSSEE